MSDLIDLRKFVQEGADIAWNIVPTTIVIADRYRASPRKISKIVPYTDGGFGVMLPYHNHRRGYLSLHEVKYGGVHSMDHSGIVREYTLDGQVKLSLHPDGFVQFSSAGGRVISGRDPRTGKPRALGIMSSPFSKPVSSGPTFGMTVWGLNQFKTAGRSRGNQRVLAIDERSFEYERNTQRGWNAYMVAGYLVPMDRRAGVFNFRGELWARLALPSWHGHPAGVPIRIIPLHSQSRVRASCGHRQSNGRRVAPETRTARQCSGYFGPAMLSQKVHMGSMPATLEVHEHNVSSKG